MSAATEKRWEKARREMLAAESLGSGSTPIEAAMAAGVTPATVYQWLRNKPTFRLVVTELRGRKVKQHAAYAMEQICKSIDALAAVRDTTESEARKVKTAELIIDIALRLHTEADVLPRLALLEMEAAKSAQTLVESLDDDEDQPTAANGGDDEEVPRPLTAAAAAGCGSEDAGGAGG